MNLGRVTQLQLYMLFSQYLFTTIIGLLIQPLIQTSRYMIVFSLIFGSIGGLFVTFLSYRLALNRPAQFFIHYGKDIVGKYLHYPLVIFMLLVYLLIGGMFTRALLDFIIEIYLPATPAWIIAVVFGICLVYAVRSGVETIFRSAQGVFLLMILGIIIVPFFVGKEIKMDMIYAFFNHFNFKESWRGTYFMMAIYGEMAQILLLFPYFADNNKTFKSLCWAAATSVVVTLTNLIPTLLIFGIDLTSNLTYPELELIRYIQVGNFFQNLDPLLIALLMTGLFIKVSLLLFTIVISLTHAFSLKNHKPFSLSLTAIMIGLSFYMVRSVMEFNDLVMHGFFTLMIFGEMIPIIYLIVEKIRSFGWSQSKDRK